MDQLEDPALGARAIVGLVQANVLVGAAGGGAQVAQAPRLAVSDDNVEGVGLASHRREGPRLRLVGVDVHTVGKGGISRGAGTLLLGHHVALAQRLPARLGVVGGHDDILLARGIGAAYCLEHPLLPLGAICGGAEHRAHGVAIGAGARVACAVQVAQEFD